MISEELKEKIIELYKSGKTMNYIIKNLNVPKSTVSYYINKEGISRYKHPVEITEELLDKMQKLYNECGNLSIVSKKYNVSINRLKYLKRRDVKYNTKYEILKNRRLRIKKNLVDYKGGKCILCG